MFHPFLLLDAGRSHGYGERACHTPVKTLAVSRPSAQQVTHAKFY
jgi:hypothetical protein